MGVQIDFNTRFSIFCHRLKLIYRDRRKEASNVQSWAVDRQFNNCDRNRKSLLVVIVGNTGDM
ncbi:hypothetical protein HAX54_004173, partial [Datura stramonium]|nr:hypothetical protein [Datura stramonium]